MERTPSVSRSRPSELTEVWEAHLRYEFAEPDVEATMATMVEEPYVCNFPSMMGGFGAEGVRRFYGEQFIGRMPADTEIVPISRTVAEDRIVEELVVRFTHDVPVDYLLPGIPPTGRRVELPHVVIIQFEKGKIASERLYWDQASLLAQVGLIDPAGLPVHGAEQARRLIELTRGCAD